MKYNTILKHKAVFLVCKVQKSFFNICHEKAPEGVIQSLALSYKIQNNNLSTLETDNGSSRFNFHILCTQ
jgi:hypothetical protein